MGATKIGGYAWVAASIREFGDHIGGERHLVHVRPFAYRYSLDTLCGASASVPGIWRGNSTKPKCRTCKEFEEKCLST